MRKEGEVEEISSLEDTKLIMFDNAHQLTIHMKMITSFETELSRRVTIPGAVVGKRFACVKLIIFVSACFVTKLKSSAILNHEMNEEANSIVRV